LKVKSNNQNLTDLPSFGRCQIDHSWGVSTGDSSKNYRAPSVRGNFLSQAAIQTQTCLKCWFQDFLANLSSTRTDAININQFRRVWVSWKSWNASQLTIKSSKPAVSISKSSMFTILSSKHRIKLPQTIDFFLKVCTRSGVSSSDFYADTSAFALAQIRSTLGRVWSSKQRAYGIVV
jgi:hypothetical protein